MVTFAWSWLIWLPLVLAGAGIIPLGKNLLSALTVPWITLGVFGPAIGAFYCLRTSRGKGAVCKYLSGLLDLRLGWWGWFAAPLVLGGTTWLAWKLLELWGEPRLKMLLPSAWVFLPYLLLMVFLGGGQEELGWRGYILDPLEERLGPWLGNVVLGVVWAVWHVVASGTEAYGKLQFGPPKTYQRRAVPIPQALVAELTTHLAGKSGADFVFTSSGGGPLRHSNFYVRHFKPAVLRAGLPEATRFHDLRHSYAAMLIAEGAHPRAIMERLGRSTIQVTLRTYGHVFPSLEASLTAALDDVYRTAEPMRPAKVREIER